MCLLFLLSLLSCVEIWVLLDLVGEPFKIVVEWISLTGSTAGNFSSFLGDFRCLWLLLHLQFLLLP